MAQHFKRNVFDIGKTLVKRSLQSEKRRNIMIILAISLSAFIMSMCGIGIFSSVQTKKICPGIRFKPPTITFRNRI